MRLPTRLLAVIGTRPEAIKLAPLIRVLSDTGRADMRVCLTGQHRELLAQSLQAFPLAIDLDLAVMADGLEIPELTGRMIAALGPAMRALAPDCVIVQGDTNSAVAAALTGFQLRLPVAHVEAGLRSFDPAAPWPEETNRRLIAQIATFHYAPTARARRNLLAEGIADSAIEVTGNTGIDALTQSLARIDADPTLARPAQDLAARAGGRRLLLATVHRRESVGPGLARIADALGRIAGRGDCLIILPAHPNPPVMAMARALAAAHPAIQVVAPLDYLPFIALMRHAALILTDSGGIQEEATAMGKPVVVLRDRTERPELMDCGNGVLAGTATEGIVAAVNRLLDDPAALAAMSRPGQSYGDGPYGDGRAALRIASHLLASLQARAAA